MGGGVQVGNGGDKESPSPREPREPEMGECIHWRLKTPEVPVDTRMGLWVAESINSRGRTGIQAFSSQATWQNMLLWSGE